MPNFYKQHVSQDKDSANECGDYEKHKEPKTSRAWFGEPPKKSPKRSPNPIKREFSQARLLEYDLNAQTGQETNVLVRIAYQLEPMASSLSTMTGGYVCGSSC
jgi:hypothetical protein